MGRISQGDVIRDIECIEYVAEKRGVLEVSKIKFPIVVVLTQDCDLEQDFPYRNPRLTRPKHDNRRLLSVLVVPLYNAEHVFQGNHLSELSLKMTPIEGKTRLDMLKKNEIPRYHYLDFPSDIPIVPSIADFKHYFSVNIGYLGKTRAKNFVCRLSELYREDLSQRFAAYLARIGLPEISPVPPSLLAPPSATAPSIKYME